MERIIIPVGLILTAVVFWRIPQEWRMSFLAAAYSVLLLCLDPAAVSIMLAMSVAMFACIRMSAFKVHRAGLPVFAIFVALISSYLIVVK